jgi:hypothetical protein
MSGTSWVILLFSVLILSCAAAPIAGECQETIRTVCMTKKICAEDKKRGCLICTCEAAWETNGQREDQRLRGRGQE